MAEPVVEEVVEEVVVEEQVKPEPKPPVVKTVPKNMYDKLASEVADYKKKLKERMTAEEAAALHQQELQDRLEQYEKEKKVTAFEKQFLKVGVDEADASKIAIELSEGNVESLISHLDDFKKKLEVKLRDEIIKGTPKPPNGTQPKTEGDSYKKAMQEGRMKDAIRLKREEEETLKKT